MSGGDRTAFLVQWLSFAGALVGVSLMARDLGAERQGQIMATTFSATLPMAVLQASSTQNDLVAGFWLVAALVLLRRLESDLSVATAVLAGGAIGLLLLTKTTGFVCFLSFGFWLAARTLLRHRLPALGLLAVAVLFAVVINSGHLVRNQMMFGNPVAPAREVARYRNENLGPSVLGSNAVRNAALQIATPWRSVNAVIEKGTARLHDALGIEFDPPGSAFRDLPFALEEAWRNENTAAAPVHLLLLLAAGGVAFVRSSPFRSRAGVTAFLLCGIAGFVAFSGLFRWQPAQGRLLLPLMLLGGPWFGAAIEASSRRRLQTTLGLALVLLTTPLLLAHEVRPLVGAESTLRTLPEHEYFNARPEERQDFLSVIDRLLASDCRRIDLNTRENSYEYPLWALLRLRSADRWRIEHTRGTRESRKLRDRDFRACAQLTLHGGKRRNRLELEAE